MMPARRLGTLAHIPDPSILYEDHKRIIFKIAGKYSARYGFEMTDLISVGNETFLKSMKRWDPARGKFSTYLTTCLRNSFNNMLKKESREPCSSINMPMELDQNNGGQDPEAEGLKTSPFQGTGTPFHDPLWLEDVVRALSDDAREVVRLLFEDDLGPTISDHPVYVKAALKRALGREWGKDRIVRAFDSIARSLSV